MERAKTHPIFIAAGAAVLLFSLLGAAALTGMLPAASPKPGEPVAVAQAGNAPGTPSHPGSAVQLRGTAAAPCANCGVIDAIHAVEVQGEASGLGAVAGGVAGAVVGSQFGHGTGRTLLTLGGAAGGAYAGNTIEKSVKKHTAWRVTVRLEDGTVRTLSQSAQPPFAVGDRVRIVNSTLERA
ncbi:MAG TPA: glycine zipper 2TM domain-containing protein [Steroidobacteraceae bacterium]|nr:glycine zipper 2TM domain-containing protein [Steroidobacteraceae bacterium]